MPVTVNPEVLEGLQSLQQKIEEGEKSIAFYENQVIASQEVVDRETTRVAGLKTGLDAAKSRLGVAVEETLSFDTATGVVKTETEVVAEKAILEDAKAALVAAVVK